jgi:alkylated DNA repair dioxygenase AlkB
MIDEVTFIPLSRQSWIDQFTLSPTIPIDFEVLWNIHPDMYGLIKVAGKEISTPRWQQTYGRSYTFSGMDHPALPIPKEVQHLHDWANESMYGPFNQVLINWYQNGNHYIGKHSDDERPLVPQAPILSISLGAERVFRIRDKETQEIVNDITMTDGMVLVMGGMHQREFLHEVPKISGAKGDRVGRRINITFRRFKD